MVGGLSTHSPIDEYRVPNAAHFLTYFSQIAILLVAFARFKRAYECEWVIRDSSSRIFDSHVNKLILMIFPFGAIFLTKA